MRRIVLLAAVTAAVLLPAGSVLADSAADKAMAQQIGVELKESGQLRDYRIGVKFIDGVAWLNGTVASPQQRDTAIQLTKSMDGVAHVVSKLEVTGPSASLPAIQPPASDQVSTADYAADQPSNILAAAAVTMSRMRPGSGNGMLSRSSSSKHTPTRTTSASRSPRNNMPMPLQRVAARPAAPQQAGCYVSDGPAGMGMGMGMGMPPARAQAPAPMAYVPGGQARPVSYDNAQMPGYAWPSYASYPNYAALTYPRQYSPAAWPYIGPFYPYPQVPLGWRKVALEWDDGWWFLDFSSCGSSH